ncbi:MAG TPA: ATP-binding protein [Candidatus Angelobacter sp.]|nr:ATP-binding protein [Candidatus Angelobacter sp.]
MRRSAWIFLAAILLPSLVLAWMAVRSARDQQVILEHQQAIICQNITDALAKQVQDQVDSSRQAFVQTTDQLLQASPSSQVLAATFNQQLHRRWNLAEVGFSVDLRGIIYSPNPYEGVVARAFRNENDRFLSNRENVEVFAQNTAKPAKKIETIFEEANQAASPQQATTPLTQSNDQLGRQRNAQRNNQTNDLTANQSTSSNTTGNQSAETPRQAMQKNAGSSPEPSSNAVEQSANQSNSVKRRNVPPQETQSNNQAAQVQQPAPPRQSDGANEGNAPQRLPPKVMSQAVQIQRQVEPQSNFGQNAFSNTVPEESDFRKVIGAETSGALARFLEDKLRLMVWYRPKSGSLVFGAQLMQQGLVDNLQTLLQAPEFFKTGSGPESAAEYSLVILDDRGKPVAFSRPGFKADWKHPFAATEIGEALPHWEAALYLVDPRQINRSASTLQLALASIVAVLVAAILLGGWLIATDVRRQMRLAQQKTDFVSNVSHELKTPLTSIRMFADMLAEGRVEERDRQANYLRIISAESARLTRLINNVLDFARMERGAPLGERRPCDLAEVVREVVSTCQPHLEAVGVALSLEVEADEFPLMADRDAIAQIILNLISNAEKYGGHEVLVRVRRENRSGLVEVLDRGPGIPQKKREVVFQPFHRLHDSLASGVSGSGLGLTLARRMAQAHGGNVTYSSREGGGSCFTFSVPLSPLDAKAHGAQPAGPGNEAT